MLRSSARQGSEAPNSCSANSSQPAEYCSVCRLHGLDAGEKRSGSRALAALGRLAIERSRAEVARLRAHSLERIAAQVEVAVAADLVHVKRRLGLVDPVAVVLEPAVEPAQLHPLEVDPLGRGQVQPGTHQELVAAGRALPGFHRRGDRPPGDRVLEPGVVERRAALVDVPPAADEEHRDPVADDRAQQPLRPARAPVGAVERLLPLELDVYDGVDLEAEQSGDVLELDPDRVGDVGVLGEHRFDQRIDRVERRGDAEEDDVEAERRDAAEEGDVAV